MMVTGAGGGEGGSEESYQVTFMRPQIERTSGRIQPDALNFLNLHFGTPARLDQFQGREECGGKRPAFC